MVSPGDLKLFHIQVRKPSFSSLLSFGIPSSLSFQILVVSKRDINLQPLGQTVQETMQIVCQICARILYTTDCTHLAISWACACPS